MPEIENRVPRLHGEKISKAIILVSGGMDSLVTTAIASKDYDMSFLHINYGQRTENRELKAFNEIAEHYNVKDKLVADVKYLAQIGGSSLTDKNIDVTKADIQSSYIPSS